MLDRICYGITAAWQYRAQLKRYMADPALQIAEITQLTPQYFLQHNVTALTLDFDGVLASHAEPDPRPEVLEWLRACILTLPDIKFYILSNKPTEERLEYFKIHFPQIIFVIAAQKKPYPAGLQQIADLAKCSVGRVMLVDDRLTTGVLAAVLAGAQACWINASYTNFLKRPIRESFFFMLRSLERLFVRLIG